MFVSNDTYHARNLREGESLRARAAILEGPTGKEPGVAILTGYHPRYVLREDHAIALCNAIIDSLDEHRTGGKR